MGTKVKGPPPLSNPFINKVAARSTPSLKEPLAAATAARVADLGDGEDMPTIVHTGGRGQAAAAQGAPPVDDPPYDDITL